MAMENLTCSVSQRNRLTGSLTGLEYRQKISSQSSGLCQLERMTTLDPAKINYSILDITLKQCNTPYMNNKMESKWLRYIYKI